MRAAGGWRGHLHLHYARAGLCRSTLALSVSSELAARQVIARAAARSARRV